ncbi:MAG: Gfo/Idh/MocA family oxidoreductase [Rhodospirillales bacterium]|nr:Gfo/Idh/MocA family oxidoreductase [Rhodospirillales bacterium]
MMRIGWLGCGTHAGEMLLPQLVRLPVRLAAIADTDPARLAMIGDRYGVSDRFTDAAALLDHPGLDAIGMAMGPAQHARFGAMALERGLAVFMEKPPAPTAREAAILAETAARTGKPCVVGFMKRYSTANRIAGNILHAPGFGAKASLLGEYMTAPTYFVGNPDYTGFLLHHCVHAMDLVPWLMGEAVASVTVRKHEMEPGKLLLHAGFGFASGALATVVMGTHQSRGTPMEWWQVMGDHQRVEMRNVHEVRHFRSPIFKAADPAATLDPASDTLVWEPNLTAAANEDHKGYHALLAAFVARVKGEASDAPEIADGVRAMRVLEAMIRAMASGKEETP